MPSPDRADRRVRLPAAVVEHGFLVRGGVTVSAEACEAGVHVGTDAAGVEADRWELEDVVGARMRIERELAPEGDEAGATADGAAPADEDPEAGPRGADLEEVGGEPGPDQGEERVVLRRPRGEVRGVICWGRPPRGGGGGWCG